MSSPSTLKCAICQAEVEDWLGEHLQTVHGLTVGQYQATTGGKVVSDRVAAKAAPPANLRRAHPASLDKLTVSFSDKGLSFPVNTDVPPEACLPEPPNYKTPEHGDLGFDVAYALMGIQRGRSMFIWGPPGTGKDALFHVWSARTRTPGIIRQVIPGTDIESWFFSRSFNEHGTAWEEGEVLKALRDGYITQTGRRVPYLVLFSDLDRAQKDQAEYMRLITDSISGRIQGPAGKTYNVLPGTRIVATANTSGGGDTTGRMVSSNPIDGSILNRIEYKLRFHSMDWKDEEPVVRAKFPALTIKFPEIFAAMGKATKAMRAAIEGQTIYGEFSHRDVCHILQAADDFLANTTNPKAKQALLKHAFRIWLDGLPDDDTRKAASNIIDPHIQGGMVASGKPATSSDPLADI